MNKYLIQWQEIDDSFDMEDDEEYRPQYKNLVSVEDLDDAGLVKFCTGKRKVKVTFLKTIE